MAVVNWLFPHPFLTLVLTIVWITLQNAVSPGMVVFGLILGIIIPKLTAAWWPDRPTAFLLDSILGSAAASLRFTRES